MKMATWLLLLIAVIRTEAFLFGSVNEKGCSMTNEQCYTYYVSDYENAVTPENPFVFVGENLTLSCENMKERGNGNISGFIYFKRGNRRIPGRYMKAMSGQSIELTYPVLRGEDDGSYTCYMNDTLLGQQMVTVEYRPRQLKRKDVSVLVDDWRRMNVSWNVSDHWIHPDLVQSELYWRIKNGKQDCPLRVNNINNITDACLWKEHDGRNSFKNVPYWITIAILVFNKSGIEMNRTESKEFFIDTNIYVKPAPVVNLTAYKVLSTSVCLSWQVTQSSRMRDIQHEVVFNGRQQPKIVEKTPETHMCVDVLRPYTEYTVSVSTMPLINGTPKGHHSDSIELTVTTEQDVPVQGPAVVPGCFHFGTCRDNAQCFLTIYWQLHAGKMFDWSCDYNALELNALLLNGSWNTIGNKRIFTTMGLKPAAVPEERSNGRISTYDINMTNISGTDKRSYQQSGSQRSLKLQVQRQDYLVTLSASTEAGPSQNITTMFIPDSTGKPSYPELIVEAEGGRIFVRWTASRELEVNSYTLFYCNTSKLEHSCLLDEDIQWIELPANKNDHVFEVHSLHDILTGISVQVIEPSGRLTSSGINWSICIFNRNKVPDQPENVVFSELQPDFSLKIEWDRHGCREGEPYILFYIVEYCQGISTCTGSISNKNISTSKTQHTIKDLDTGESYRVTLRAVSLGGVGPSSDPIVATVGYSGLSVAEIAGIAITAVFLSTFLLAGIVFFSRRIHRGIQTFKLPIDVPQVDQKDTFALPVPKASFPSNTDDNKGGSTKKLKELKVGTQQAGLGEENASPVFSRNISTSESLGSDNSHTLLIASQEIIGKRGNAAQAPSVVTDTHSSAKLDQESGKNKVNHGIHLKRMAESSTCVGTQISGSTCENACDQHIKDDKDSLKIDMLKRIKDEALSKSGKGSDNFGYRSTEDLEMLDSNSAENYSIVGEQKAALPYDTNFDYVSAPCLNN